MILTIDRHRTFEAWTRLRLRVLVDGVDVTDRCFCADPGRGWAAVYSLDDRGRLLVGFDGSAARTIVEGRVTLRVFRPSPNERIATP